MKFIHISDLHLGKRVNEFSMMEEQKYILQQVLDTVQNEAADAVLIAGIFTISRCRPQKQLCCLIHFLRVFRR